MKRHAFVVLAVFLGGPAAAVHGQGGSANGETEADAEPPKPIDSFEAYVEQRLPSWTLELPDFDPPQNACACASELEGKHEDDRPWVVYEGRDGAGRGMHVVLVAGDEEYRSEEVLPQLGKILAVHHGFRCTVLFATDPETGEIDPEEPRNIEGLEVLESADALVLFTRFRRLPDEAMRHVVRYVERGGPILGIRTATHAFAYPDGDESPYAHWRWNDEGWPGGFGRQVLGETWVRHHGEHGAESTRGVVPEAARGHPIVRGMGELWGPTDVYGIGELPPDATVLVEGLVLDGMTPDAAPAPGPRNDPPMPIAWTRERRLPSGAFQRVVCSTIGAAPDFANEGVRRLLVNAVHWCVGLEHAIGPRARVDLVGTFDPSPFGFGGFRRGVRPRDHAP